MANLLNQARRIISAAPSAQGAGTPPSEAEDELADDAPASEFRSFTVPAQHHGERLDRALAALVPELSRSYLNQLVGEGAARINASTVTKPAQRLRAGDRIDIELRPTPMSQAFVPQALPLDVVYEDEHLIVIHKPAGLVVHPAPGHWGGTLLNALLARDAGAARLLRAGIVHRLDKDTSGLMVVARTAPAMEALVALLAARQVTREYLALAHGPWRGLPEREVDAPIGRDPRHRLRMAVVDMEQHPGKPAQTQFELLQATARFSLLRCRLRTGRTHQIRVHLAHLGHPLVADALYGGMPAAGLTRQALHARRLAFEHPITGQALDFRTPLPADLAAALAACGLTMPADDPCM